MFSLRKYTRDEHHFKQIYYVSIVTYDINFMTSETTRKLLIRSREHASVGRESEEDEGTGENHHEPYEDREKARDVFCTPGGTDLDLGVKEGCFGAVINFN